MSVETVASLASTGATLVLALVATVQLRALVRDRNEEEDIVLVKEFLRPLRSDVCAYKCPLHRPPHHAEFDNKRTFSSWGTATTNHPLMEHKTWRSTRHMAQRMQEQVADVRERLEACKPLAERALRALYDEHGLTQPKHWSNIDVDFLLVDEEGGGPYLNHEAWLAYHVTGGDPFEDGLQSRRKREGQRIRLRVEAHDERHRRFDETFDEPAARAAWKTFQQHMEGQQEPERLREALDLLDETVQTSLSLLERELEYRSQRRPFRIWLLHRLTSSARPTSPSSPSPPPRSP